MKFLSLFFCLTAMLVFSINASAQTTFTNSTPIVIADRTDNGIGVGNPYPSTIAVSGLTGTVTDVNVRINNLTHTFPDDVGLMLVAPNGAFMVIQSDVGGGGDYDAVNLTYTLDDQAATGIPADAQFPAGSYKPSSVNDNDFFPLTGSMPPPQDCLQPGECPQAAPAGSATLNGIFSGISPNGVWKLYAIDQNFDDTGSITGGWSLVLTTSGGNPTPRDANVDFNGDGKTDYVVTRGTDTPFAESIAESQAPLSLGLPTARQRLAKMNSQDESAIGGGVVTRMTWYTSINGSNATSVGQLGNSNDATVPEDYDGDGKDDLAVWRSGAPNQAAFYIYQSSTNTVRTEIFGQAGDDPFIAGDYDGDNKADPAVFRCPTTPGQCYFFYRGSLNNPNRITTFVPWGFGRVGDGNTIASDFFVNPGDFDGDGKNDFCLQRTRPGTTTGGQFVLLRSSDLGVEYISLGLNNDIIVPGDFDGDGKFDFCVARNELINNVAGFSYYILERDGGGTGASPIRFGLAPTNTFIGDYIVPGDYDGDGKQDIAVWREDADPTKNFFYIRRSSDGALQTFEWGKAGDYPVANSYVH